MAGPVAAAVEVPLGPVLETAQGVVDLSAQDVGMFDQEDLVGKLVKALH